MNKRVLFNVEVQYLVAPKFINHFCIKQTVMIKRIAYILLLILISISAFSQKKVKIDLNPSKQIQKNVEEVQNISNGILISESISFIELIQKETKEGTFIELSSDRMYKSFDKGKPNLPLICRLIEIPQNTKPVIKVLSYDEEIVKLTDYKLLEEIIPAQPSISKSDDPEKIPFYKNKDIYSRNEFFKNDIIKYEDKGFLRSKHLGYIEISPFEYNPVENTLKILNNIKVEVSFVDDVSTKSINTKSLISPYFEDISLNTLNTSSDSKALISGPVKYVIVSDRMFEETLQPFIEWKIMKGFNVIEAYTDDSNVGNTTTTIKAYLKDLYENPVDGVSPSFVLLVGDVAQIPTFSGTAGGHKTDLYYCEYTGDKLPDVFYGRFSAESLDELQPQIDKTLEIEKYEMPDPAYLDNVVLVAGVDGTYASTRGNGAINYANDNYTNLDNGINSYYYLYNDPSGVMSSNDTDASSSIRSNISSGVSFTNYTAHCGSSGWSDPSFTISHIDGLTNDHMYPLIIGNCCESNTFYNNDCFGEEILMAANKGAVGYIGGSNLTYWDEDYYWGVGLSSTITANPTYESTGLGAYDRFFHLNGEDKQDWYITQGQINVAGNLAVEASASSLKAYYWEIYHLMGDPSLTPYVSIPAPLISSYDSEIIIGTSDFQVITEEDAYVAISFDGELLDAQLADATGVVNLSFTAFSTVGDLYLVITKQNRQPVIDEIIIVPVTTPYIVTDHYLIDDALGNNNSEIDFGETIKLDIQLKNLSKTYDAYNVIANLSSADTNVIISDFSETFGTILKSDSAFIEASFTIDFKNKFIDQQKVNFDLEIIGEDVSSVEYTWNYVVSYFVNAPILEIGELFVDDDLGNANRILDPGETADVSLVVSNIGSASISNLNGLAMILAGGTHLTLNNSETGSFNLNAQETDTLKFNATADSETINGTSIYFTFDIDDELYDYYSKTESLELKIGEIPEILISDGNTIIPTCAYFYDSGGKTGNYTNNENYTITFEPDNINKFISVNFLSFEIESHSSCDYDRLLIYNGKSTADELIGEYCGTVSPGYITANNSDGALTFVFISDISEIRSGWEAEIKSVDILYDFHVEVSSNGEFVQGALVEFYNKEVISDENGIAHFYDVPQGINYSLSVSAIGYHDFETSVNLFEDLFMECNLEVAAYNVKFILKSESIPVYNVQVILKDDTLYTDTLGIVEFENVVQANDIPYKISKLNFNDIEGFLNVLESNLTINKVLTYKSFDINFKINDGLVPIEGATINFDGKSGVSNSKGEFIFNIPYSLNQVYNISKEGYTSVSKMINVDENKTIEESLTSITGITTVNESDIKVYPNPSSGIFNLEIFNSKNNTYIVKIYDIIGSVVYSKNIKSAYNILEQIDITNKSKGIYLLSVESNNGSVLCKRIITK